MPQIDGQLLKAQFENFTGIPTTGMAPGRVWADITNPTAAVPSFFDGTNTQRLLSTANFQNLLLPYNIGLSATVAANALTINLLGNNLQSPSVSNPLYVPFRDSTSVNGDTVSRAVIAPISITVPSGATLGLFSNVVQYLYLWAVDNAGTVALAVSGSWRFCNWESIQSTTAITSGSTGNKVLYSAAALTNKAVRLLARFTINQTSIGTWAAIPTETCIYNGTPFATPVPEGISFSNLSGTSLSADWGAASAFLVPYYRLGNRLVVTSAYFVAGSTGNAPSASVNLPTGMNVDYREVLGTASTLLVGNYWDLRSQNLFNYTAGTPGAMMVDGSTQNLVWFAPLANGGTFIQQPADNITVAGSGISFQFSVPIQEWACY